MKRKEVAMVAIAAAKAVVAGKASITEAALQNNVSRDVVSEAKLILSYGSVEEIKAVETGASSITPIAAKIRRALPAETREAYRKRHVNGIYTEDRRANLHAKAILWAKLGPALRGLTELPLPSDMVKVVKGNGIREGSVNQYLNTATKWLEEFNHEWNKTSINEDDTVDAGGSNATSGSQHPEPTAE